MKIYTGTGDSGYTSLLGGKRVSKADKRVETYGTLDEANSVLGLAKNLTKIPSIRELIEQIQHKLFSLGAEIASEEKKNPQNIKLTQNDVQKIEQLIDDLQQRVPRKTEFVVPGGTTAAAALDLARTIIRRAERTYVSLIKERDINAYLLQYLNRLSDLLFVMGRIEEYEILVRKVTEQVTRKMSVVQDKKLLQIAQDLARAAEEEALNLKVPMVIAVVDKGGNMILCHRMDDSLLGSLDIALNKAFTAVAVQTSTHNLGKQVQPGQPLYGFPVTNQGRIVVFGGGYPLFAQGKLIMGLGVSGGTVEEDMKVAETAIKRVFAERGGR